MLQVVPAHESHTVGHSSASSMLASIAGGSASGALGSASIALASIAPPGTTQNPSTHSRPPEQSPGTTQR